MGSYAYADTVSRLEYARSASEAAQVLCALGPMELATFLEEAGVQSGGDLVRRLKAPRGESVESRSARLKVALDKIDVKLQDLDARKREMDAFGGDEARYEAVLLDEKMRELAAHAERLRDLQAVLVSGKPDAAAIPGYMTLGISQSFASTARSAASPLSSTKKKLPSVTADLSPWRAPAPAGKEYKTLRDVFDAFCAVYRQTEMTNLTFVKFCRDGKLCDGKYPKASVDLVWTRVTGKNKKVPYETFLKLLDEIARAKGVERQVVDDYVLQHARPVISGTRGSSKFYDDKSNWTGVAKKGGPSNYNPVISLATLTNTGR